MKFIYFIGYIFGIFIYMVVLFYCNINLYVNIFVYFICVLLYEWFKWVELEVLINNISNISYKYNYKFWRCVYLSIYGKWVMVFN